MTAGQVRGAEEESEARQAEREMDRKRRSTNEETVWVRTVRSEQDFEITKQNDDLFKSLYYCATSHLSVTLFTVGKS